MRSFPAIVIALTLICGAANGAEVTYTRDIAPVMREMCSECHGVASPDRQTFLRNEKKYADEKTGPRLSTYAEVWASWFGPRPGR